MRSRIQISNGTIFKSEVIQTLHLGVAHIIDRRGLSVLCSFLVLVLFCLLSLSTTHPFCHSCNWNDSRKSESGCPMTKTALSCSQLQQPVYLAGKVWAAISSSPCREKQFGQFFGQIQFDIWTNTFNNQFLWRQRELIDPMEDHNMSINQSFGRVSCIMPDIFQMCYQT